MKRIAVIAGSVVIGVMAVQPAAAQGFNGWQGVCLDPANTTPYSADYGILQLSDALIRCSLGVSGTATWGGSTGPCYGPTARTMDAAGRFAFMSGPTGSVQSSFDDGLAYTVGAPFDPVGDYCYARILKADNSSGNSVLFGDGGLGASFVGASNRYIETHWADADVNVTLQMRVLGDAVRMGWTLQNISADAQPLGLMFGAYAGLHTSGFNSDSNGFNQANTGLGSIGGSSKFVDGYIGYTYLSTTRPVRNWRKYTQTSPNFPGTATFAFGQREFYGMRVDNVPGQQFQDAASADQFLVGNFSGPVSGLLVGNNMNQNVPGDTTGLQEEADILLNETCFLQRFPVQTVAPGATREIAHYIRSSWSTGDYKDPFMMVLDAPLLLAPSNTGQDGLAPNPFTVRCYVDNQFAKLDKEVALSNTKFTITLPAGLSLVAGEVNEKIVPTIPANGIRFVEWQVQSDGVSFGNKKVSVTAQPTPGPVKTISATIQIASTPKVNLGIGANMVGFPYNFSETSFNTILGLQAGVDYLAFKWDPGTAGYVQVATPKRGEGYWILPNSDLGIRTLNGASTPTDIDTGGLLTTLNRGWNMIANPYNVPVKIGDILGISEDNPSNVLTWNEMVNSGFVSSALAYYERDPLVVGAGSYKYTQTSNDVLEPHRGYWIYVTTFKPLRLSWSSVFTPGLPTTNGRAVDKVFAQTDKQWRLELAARNSSSMDSGNFVGITTDRKLAKAMTLPKPPTAPTAPGTTSGGVELSVMGDFDGQTMKMSQVFSDNLTKKEYALQVKSESAGDVTVTWPNLATLPKNIRAKLVDPATGTTKDLRAVSSYTFAMSQPGTREFKLVLETGGAAKAVIGNVMVTRPTRDINGPVTINYALSADASVTVRILSGTGKEVFTLTRGRADSAGENSVTWLLRDNANRAVAPGTYRAEILAETTNGERVRKIVPINVTR